MSPAREVPQPEILDQLLTIALQTGRFAPLETRLLNQAANVSHRQELIDSFTTLVGKIVTSPEPPVERLEALLDGWAALEIQEQAILPELAVACYARVAQVRPDWWPDEIRKLHRAASHPLPSVRATVTIVLKRLLQTDIERRTFKALQSWQDEQNPLVRQVARSSLDSYTHQE